jgi:hypothetical protein
LIQNTRITFNKTENFRCEKRGVRGLKGKGNFSLFLKKKKKNSVPAKIYSVL